MYIKNINIKIELTYDGDSLLDGSSSFGFTNSDIIEMQYITSTGQFLFMKYTNINTGF